jgi:hypothetical protein
MADPTATKQPWGDPFKPGHSGNPAGRPRGARYKLGEAASGAPLKPSHMSWTRTSDCALPSCWMTPGELTVPEWLRRSQAIAWVTLLGMLFHMAFAFGHIDGPTHRDGFLLASFERLLVGRGEEPASGHHDNHIQRRCDICIIGSMGAALPAPPAIHVLSEITFHTIDWVATAARLYTPAPASHYEIRGPPWA